MAVEWGDVPGWVSALGSVFALGFAAVAVVVTRRSYWMEFKRDKADAETRIGQRSFARRAQGVLVSAWWGSSQDGRWGAFVRNTSQLPIYQVYLTVLDPDDHSDIAKVHYLVVPPSDDAVFWQLRNEPPTERSPSRRVKLSFTDSAGVRWHRNQYGGLAELQPSLHVKAGPPRANVLAQFEADFLATYGVTVTFDTFEADPAQQRFIADLSAPTVADAMICPHDWIGDLISHDLIEPTVVCAEHRDAFPEWALSALTVGERLYGLPTTTDTVALIRNTRLVARAPTTFDEMVATGTALRESGQVTEILSVRVGEHGDPFQIWPLFSSAGGWLFGRTPDGGWDPTRIGLATPESIAAFERLRSLGEAGAGLLRRSVGRTEAIELFARGHSPYLISTADALEHIHQAAIPVAVSAVPPFADGGPATALTLVHGLFFARHGPNKIIAHDMFADYLTHHHVLAALSAGIVAPVALLGTPNQDTAIQQFLNLCASGPPIPSFPQMDATWRILEDAQAAVIAGASAKATARRAAAGVEALFTSE